MTITWTDGPGIDGIGGWLGLRLRSVFGLRAAPRQQAHEPGEPDVYLTCFRSPKASSADLRKAATLALSQLMPVSAEDLLIFGRRTNDGAELAAIRKQDAIKWETGSGRARDQELTIAPDWRVRLPIAAGMAARRTAVMIAGCLTALAAMVFLYAAVWIDQERRLEAQLEHEARARIAALEMSRAQSTLDVWGLLQTMRAPDKMPDKVIASFADLSAATTDGAYWKRIEWSPMRVIVEGFADDALMVLEGVSGAFPGSSVAFSRPVTAAQAGRQSFEIVISREDETE